MQTDSLQSQSIVISRFYCCPGRIWQFVPCRRTTGIVLALVNGADKTGILSVTDEEGTEVVRRSLDSENDYTLVENLAPGTTYHVALLKSDDAVVEG